MSQGLTWIAGRRTPLLALVAIFALSVGMFAAFSPTHAEDAVGDVSANAGWCAWTADDADNNINGFADDGSQAEDAVYVVTALEIPASGEDALVEQVNTDLTCEETDRGKTIKITPDGTKSPILEPQAPSLTVTVRDTDGVVNDDSTLFVTVTAKNFNGYGNEGGTPALMLNYIRVSGVLDIAHTDAAGTGSEVQTTIPTPNTAGGKVYANVVIPEGSPEGEYTVSARANYDHDASPATAVKVVNASKTFTVGDAGTNAAALELSLATSVNDNPMTPGNEQVDETGSTGATKFIWLKVAATNSLGDKSNDAGLNSLSVIAPGGSVEIHAAGGGDATPIGGATPSVALNANAPGNDSASITAGTVDGTTTTVTDVMYVKIGKKSGTPGTVDVYALLIGTDGAPRSESVTLTFTGSASSVALGDVANVGPLGKVEFTIDATDESGNAAGIVRASFKVADADGKAVGRAKVQIDQQTQGAHTDTPLDNNPRQVTGLVTIGETTAAGAYTITVSLVGVADSEASTEVTVVGKTADVAVSATATESSTIGDIITVTATLTDEDGNAAPDKTAVDFSVSANTGLSPIGAAHGGDTDGKGGPATKDGAASVKFAVVGSGVSVVSATSGGVSAVVVIRSTAGEAAVVDEPDPEPVDGLSQTELNNFASWSGDGTVSASELLAGIPDATGVLYYDGDSWQHYGVSDGQVIPGSRDFTVRSGYVIWISG